MIWNIKVTICIQSQLCPKSVFKGEGNLMIWTLNSFWAANINVNSKIRLWEQMACLYLNSK